MTDPARILIAEDEPAIADTLQYALASDGFAPHCCGTAADTLQAFQAERPALVILDVGLPDLNGFALFRQLQALPGGPATPMLFLTARSEEIDRVLGLELGADDYIAKPFSPRELVARVRNILRRHSLSPSAAPAPSQAAAGAFELDEDRRQIRYAGHWLELSRYEYGLLRTLLRRPGRVFSRDELLAQVWDDPGASFDRTVDAHVKTLRAKLRIVAPDQDPIRTLRGVGYALNDVPPAEGPPLR